MVTRLILLAAVALAGCRPAPTPSRRSGSASNQLPVSLGNPYMSAGRPGTLVWSALFDGLTQLTPDGRVAPALATGWRRTSPTVWRFRLRGGVRFSTGRRFDAVAGARVIDWLASPAGKRTVTANDLKLVRGARPVGPLELEIVTSKPDPLLPKRLVATMMVDPVEWTRAGAPGFAQHPAGTGPYRLVGWNLRARRATAVRNPGSWRHARIDRLVWVELPYAAGRSQALLSRDIDLTTVDIEETDRLTDRGIPVVARPSLAVMSVAFATLSPGGRALRDVRVRQALNHAVDKEAIARVMLRGLSHAAAQPAVRGASGYDPMLRPYAYDPARARRLLAEAGYSNGFALEIEVPINAYPADSLIYQALASDLRRVGVRVTLRVVTLAEYLRKLGTNGWAGGAFGASWNNSPANDVTRALENASCKRPHPWFCDNAISTELAKATAIADDSARDAALRALAKRYHDAAPALFLVEQLDLFGYRPGLTGLVIANRVPVYERIGLAQ